jgi:hypothetical protein
MKKRKCKFQTKDKFYQENPTSLLCKIKDNRTNFFQMTIMMFMLICVSKDDLQDCEKWHLK